MILNCEMVKEELFNEYVKLLNPHFQSNAIVNLEATDESEEFDTSMDTIQEIIQNFNQRGSKWRFQRVTSRDIYLAEYRTFNGSSNIELPEFITSKKAVVNAKNADNPCFKCCITRALNIVEKDPQRIKNSSEHNLRS